MMRPDRGPVLKDLVLIGGGHAHVFVIKRFAMQPMGGVRLTVISPDAHTPYSGMLPGLIAGHYSFDEAHIDLSRLCRFAGAIFVRASVEQLDLAAKQVRLRDRPPISYDLLSINAGSTPDPRHIPGALGAVLPVKPVSEFLSLWKALKAEVLDRPDLRIGIVGGGAGGVELVLSVQHAISEVLAKNGVEQRPTYKLVTSGPTILETHNAGVRSAFGRILAERRIEVITGFHVKGVETGGVVSGDRRIAMDRILWATGAQPPDWIAASGLDTDERGFLAIDRTLRSTSQPDVFGAGDNASLSGSPRPKSGVFAVRQGPPLAANLRNALLDRPLRSYRPQSKFLSLISTGDRNAVASWASLCAEGRWVWKLKDWIDRRFMSSFNDLPEMGSAKATVLPATVQSAHGTSLGDLDMRCGGCGAKIGAATLSSALDALAVRRRPDVLLGLEAPDDAAVTTVPCGQAVVQSVDMFRTFIDDPYIFGMIAANHSLGDLYAMGATPQTAMAMATLPVGVPHKTGELLFQMMSGAVAVLNAADCQLVGGHTGEGADLSLGFSVSGLIEADLSLRKNGMRLGDRLILTKPVGTGVIFAADMRAKAKGRWVQAAVTCALQSNKDAARVFKEYGATACTDVTGFGLAGHLAELARASNLGARLYLDAIPPIEGSLDLIAEGFASSLLPQNIQSVANVIACHAEETALFHLLFDPQTAGGLLASVPAGNADSCIAALKAAGYERAAAIGEVVSSDGGSGTIEVIESEAGADAVSKPCLTAA